jgi:putative SOS response-associated peptidase YedK
VPADSFVEWDRLDAKNKQPYAFTRIDGELMAFAGLDDSHLHPDTSDGDRWIATFTILTTEANEDMPIHNRPPLILEKQAGERWLDPDVIDELELAVLTAVARTGVLDCCPVNRKVGSVKNNDASCVAPITL